MFCVATESAPVRQGSTLYAGVGTAREVAQRISEWQAAGWHAFEGAPMSRVKLRGPYVPVICPHCRWAGMKLRNHHRAAHRELELPDPNQYPHIAEVLIEENRRTRQRAEAAKKPRAGQLIVRERDGFATSARIVRVADDDENSMITINVIGTDDPDWIKRGIHNIRAKQILSQWLPVARWKK